ncbi:MAG: cupin domain-containing protein [Caulobacteraceae bacterium]|nr:cupin domain-containing protein [Caulobacteraceae bacterium]
MPPRLKLTDQAASLSIGAALKARRKRMDLTLTELAEKSGLSAPFISQVERGQAAPSIVSLMGLAEALGVDINYFVSVPKPNQIVRRGDEPEYIDVGLPARYTRLSGKHEERKLEALLIEVPPGATSPTASREGEGFWYVLDGEIEVTLGKETFSLRSGDSAHFDQRHPYSMRNTGTVDTRMLWVGTPALF